MGLGTAATARGATLICPWMRKPLERAKSHEIVAAVAIPVKLAFLWRPTLPDPDDDMVLETALNGDADLIATFDLRDFAPAAERFAIEVMRPGEVVRRMESSE